MRLIWPAPMPTVAPPLAYTMALDLTCLQTVNANFMSASSWSVGTRLVTVLSSANVVLSRDWTKTPPEMLRYVSDDVFTSGIESVTSTRMLGFAVRIFSASSDAAGAMMTSRNTLTSSLAVVASSSLLNATIPPKADTGSQASAFLYASAGVRLTLTPHGFVCFTITAAGSENSATHSKAASASRRLLYESSFPCTFFAAATHGLSAADGSR